MDRVTPVAETLEHYQIFLNAIFFQADGREYE